MANKAASGASQIYAGAAPIKGMISPTRLTAALSRVPVGGQALANQADIYKPTHIYKDALRTGQPPTSA